MPLRTIQQSHRPRASNRIMRCHSLIEWITKVRLCTFQKRMASPQKDMELQRRNRGALGNTRRPSGKLDPWTTTLESRVHVQTVGLNDKKISSAFSNEEIFFLTCPFIGSLRSGCLTDFNIGLRKPSRFIQSFIYGYMGCCQRGSGCPADDCRSNLRVALKCSRGEVTKSNYS